MLTHCGRRIDRFQGAPSLFDIAVHLSKLCRYVGGCRDFWPVSLHSMVVADLAPKELEHHALLHDAPEAFANDIPRDFKTEERRSDEFNWELRIYGSLRIPPPSEEERKVVKAADIRAGDIEYVLIGPEGSRNEGPPDDLVAVRALEKYLWISPLSCVMDGGWGQWLFYSRLARSIREARKRFICSLAAQPLPA